MQYRNVLYFTFFTSKILTVFIIATQRAKEIILSKISVNDLKRHLEDMNK